MTGYERFMAALRREEPDCVPIWELIINEPTLSAWGANSLEEFVEQEDLDAITVFEDMPLRPLNPDEAERLRPDRHPRFAEAMVDEWGIIWEMTEFGIPYPITGPIRSTDDLRRYEPPDPTAEPRLQSLRSAVQRFKGRKAIVFLTHDGFEFPYNLRGGMDRLLMDYIEQPTLVHELTELVLDYKIRLMQAAIAAGADVIVSGDDYAARKGPIMSPRHFREFVFPALQRSVAAVHALDTPYIKHTDGNIWRLLDMLVEAGIDAIDPLEPLADMDIGEVKRQYGNRLAVVGNVDCTELLPYGSAEEVQAAVKETVAKAAADGGFILASSNSIHPAVQPANYRVMHQAGRQWGKYPLDQDMVRTYRQRTYISRWSR